ncbi:MAG: class II glutamine amidotransferase [Frankia sp.]
MCRLFAMSSAPRRTRATFWLVEAPDSLSTQSHQDPDGTGIGGYDAAWRPELFRWPIAAYRDREFAQQARTFESATYVAHVRYATAGPLDVRNTHPFEQAGRLFAHNGVVGGLADLETELGDYRRLVQGDTDSERFFALITKQVDAHDGDVGAGIVAGAAWAAEHLPIYCLNFVLITAGELWALRYPATNELHVLERAGSARVADVGAGRTDHLSAGRTGRPGSGRTDHVGASGGVRLHSPDLAITPAVIVASEPMDGEPGWRMIRPGELLHVDGALAVTSRIVLPDRPAHQMTLADLEPKAATAQQAA